MARMTFATTILALLFSGCLGSAMPAEPVPTATGAPEPASENIRPASTGGPSMPTHEGVDEGAEDDPMPPGGPRGDEVWRDQWVCVDAELHWCDAHTNEHTFDVAAHYGGIRVQFTVQEPLAVNFNSDLEIRLRNADGRYAGSTSFDWQPGVYPAGTVREFQVTNPATLASAGNWRLLVSSTHLVTSAFNYEARVSFVAHSDHEPPDAPETITLHTNWYFGAGVPLDWDQAANALPAGLPPAGFPGDPLLNNPCCAPDGTAANLYVLLVAYEEAWIDDQRLPGGRIAISLVIVKPSAEYDIGLMRNWALVGVVTTDPHLAAAFDGWGFDTSIGSIDMSYEPVAGSMDAISSKGKIESARTSGSLAVVGQGLIGGTFGYNSPTQRIGNWGVEGATVGPALVYHLPAHNQRGGQAAIEGRFGAIGDIGTLVGGGSAATWFGPPGGSPCENEPGHLVFEVWQGS